MWDFEPGTPPKKLIERSEIFARRANRSSGFIRSMCCCRFCRILCGPVGLTEAYLDLGLAHCPPFGRSGLASLDTADFVPIRTGLAW